MKVIGWTCIMLGGLSFVGAASAGHSVFGPLFFLGLGIALLFFAKQKKNNDIDKEQ